MRIWLIGDTHLGVRSNSTEWLETHREFFYNWLIPYLKKNVKSGDVLFHLGDVFDSRQSLNLKILNFGLECFEEISKILPIYIILGNHDCHELNSNDINSVKPLKYLHNVKVFEGPEVIRLANSDILMMPWHSTPAKELETLKKYSGCKYLFAHTDVNGINFNKWTKVEHGNLIDDFKSYKYVFSGHIHWRQQIKNITMIGCPYQLTRSDMDNKKGIWLLDPDTEKLDFIENTISPKFIKFQITDLLDTTLESANKLCYNNYVDIYLNPEMAIDFPFSQLEDNLKGYKKITFRTNDVDSIETLENINEENYSEFDILNLTKKFINSLNYDDKLKNKLFVKSQEIFKDCISIEKEL